MIEQMSPENQNPTQYNPVEAESTSPVGDALVEILDTETNIDTHTANIDDALAKVRAGEISMREYHAIEQNESQVRSLRQMERAHHIATVDRAVEQSLNTEVGAERRLSIPARIDIAKVAIASAINRLS